MLRRPLTPPAPRESAVRITLAPLDPATIRPAPAGLRFDGNAYRIDGTYARSQRPVALRKPATVVLRYPSTGTQILRLTESTWTALAVVLVLLLRYRLRNRQAEC